MQSWSFVSINYDQNILIYLALATVGETVVSGRVCFYDIICDLYNKAGQEQISRLDSRTLRRVNIPGLLVFSRLVAISWLLSFFDE